MPIFLKRWTPTFDAKKERVDEEPIWVRLSGLPMQYWNFVRFATIENKMGSFIEADMSFEESGHMSVARILVRLDLRSSLLQEFGIESMSGSFVQTLDYEGIPIKSHRCHAYGHGVVDCTLPFKGKPCFTKGDEQPVEQARPSTDVRLEEGGFEAATKDLHAEKESSGTPIMIIRAIFWCFFLPNFVWFID
jgi:hypothetical protein